MTRRLPNIPFELLRRRKLPTGEHSKLYPCGKTITLPKDPRIHPDPPLEDPAKEMMRIMLQGYHPVFKSHPLGREVESLLNLNPSQQMCYHNNTLFGGYLAFLLDQVLADCCNPGESAVTAYLNTSFIKSIHPTVPIRLRAWPQKVEGRKILLKGSIQVPGKSTNGWLDAVQAEALFIRPKP